VRRRKLKKYRIVDRENERLKNMENIAERADYPLETAVKSGLRKLSHTSALFIQKPAGATVLRCPA